MRSRPSTTGDARQRRARVAAIASSTAHVGFFAVVVLSPFRGRWVAVERRTPPIYGEFTDVLVSASDVALAVTLVGWLVARRLDRRRVVFGPRVVAWPAGLLLAVAAVGVPFAFDVSLSAMTTLRLAALLALAVYVADEVEHVRHLVLPTCVMVAVQAVIGIGQVVGQRSLALGRLGEHLLRPELGVSVITTAGGTRVLRAYGLTDHPNILGGMLAFGTLVIVGGAASGSRGRHGDVDRRPRSEGRRDLVVAISFAVLALAGGCLFLTFSRGAWIATVAGLVVLVGMLALGPERGAVMRACVGAGAVVLGVAPFVGPFHDVVAARTDRTSTIQTEVRSLDERHALSDITSRIVVDHPLLGVGVGGLPLAMRAADPDFRYDYQPAAAVLLDVTAETGFIGGFAYLVLLTAPWIAMVRHRRTWNAELAAASAVLAAVTVVGFVDYYTWTYAPGRIWMWLALGWWAGAYARSRQEPSSDV